MMIFAAISQAPQGISHQAVIRNADNELVINSSIGIKVSILQSSAEGTVVYSETQNPSSNINGLISFVIGQGDVLSGVFSAINWTDGPYYIKTEADPSGGTNYSIQGTSQIMSVPYALQANSAETVSGIIPENDPLWTASPSFGITTTSISNWNNAYGWGNHVGLYKPNSYVPAWSEITGKPSFATVATSGSYNDLFDKPTIVNTQWTTAGSAIHYNTGNVGIGVSNPAYKLEINGGNYSYIKFFNNSSGTSTTDGFVIGTTPTGNPVWIWNYELGNIHFGINNTNRMVIHSTGHVEILGYLDVNSGIASGTALKVNDTEALWWNGTYFSWGYGGTYNYFADKVTIGNNANPGYMLYVQGTAYATGSWNSSDACFKKNIVTIDQALDKLMKVRGRRFEFRRDEFTNYQFSEGPQYGFIAQELEQILPELVNTDSNGHKSVNYDGMIPVLLEALKEQQHTIEKLKSEILQLKSETKDVNARLEKLEG